MTSTRTYFRTVLRVQQQHHRDAMLKLLGVASDFSVRIDQVAMHFGLPSQTLAERYPLSPVAPLSYRTNELTTT